MDPLYTLPFVTDYNFRPPSSISSIYIPRNLPNHRGMMAQKVVQTLHKFHFRILYLGLNLYKQRFAPRISKYFVSELPKIYIYFKMILVVFCYYFYLFCSLCCSLWPWFDMHDEESGFKLTEATLSRHLEFSWSK